MEQLVGYERVQTRDENGGLTTGILIVDDESRVVFVSDAEREELDRRADKDIADAEAKAAAAGPPAPPQPPDDRPVA